MLNSCWESDWLVTFSAIIIKLTFNYFLTIVILFAGTFDITKKGIKQVMLLYPCQVHIGIKRK